MVINPLCLALLAIVMGSSDYAIEINDLQKYYGKIRGIERVSFKVKRGTIHGFLGPNGAGKTTTIRILVSLLKPTSGNALIHGHQVTDPIVKSLIGYLPSDLNFTSITLSESILTSLKQSVDRPHLKIN